MSANNFILIRQTNPVYFSVEEQDMESGQVLETIGEFTSAPDALEAAADFMEENEVEGGIVFRKYTP